jgi:quinol monooxygenase YgiN
MAKRFGKKSVAKTRAGKKRKARTQKRSSSPGGKLAKHAVTLVVLLKAREGQEPLLEAELRALVGPTRRENGCIRYDLHRAADAPGGYLLHEVWASREAHRLHTLTPHFIRWNARKDAVLASRDVTFWTQVV